jgi:hypothetical protein
LAALVFIWIARSLAAFFSSFSFAHSLSYHSLFAGSALLFTENYFDIIDIFHTFHVVQREMISNNNDLYFCNIGREEKAISKFFLKSDIMIE